MKTNGKLARDLKRVLPILQKDPYTLTPAEIDTLLQVYRVSFHLSGKIKGVLSLDSSASACEFCKYMRAVAIAHPELNIICAKCYDVKQEQYRTGVKERHALNLLIMKTVLFTEAELLQVQAAEIVRINSSGDIDNLTHARNMIRYAKAHKGANVAIWSKNFDMMKKAFEIEGKPCNLVYIASSPVIDKAITLPKFADYTFTVYSTPEKLQETLNAGAMACNGAKCRDCGFKCYFGKWPKGANIAELLR